MYRYIKDKVSSSPYLVDSISLMSGNVIAQMIGVVGIPLLARLYSPEDFAVQNLFLAGVALMSSFIAWRVEYLIQLPKSIDESRNLHFFVLNMGLMMTLVVTLVSFIVISFLTNVTHYGFDYWWIYLVPIVSYALAVSVSSQQMLQKSRQFTNSGVSEISGKATYIASGVLLSAAGTGSLGLILTTFFSSIGKIIYTYSRFTLVRGNPLIRFRNSFVSSKPYLSLSSSMVGSNVLITLAGAIPMFAMSSLYGNDLLGQYALAATVIFLPSSIVGASLGQVYFQRAAKSWSNGESIHSLWKNTARALLFIGVPLYMAIFFLSPFIFVLIFGSEWEIAGKYASWLSITALFSFISSPLDKTALITRKSWYPSSWSLLRTTLAILVVYVSEAYDVSGDIFIQLLILQSCFVYVVDLVFSFIFSLNVIEE